jgi:hypothetical protein
LDGGKAEAADTFEVVDHLFVFVLELRVVLNVLPAAAAAGTEMLAEGFLAIRGVLADGCDPGFQEGGLDLGKRRIDDIAGGAAFQENDQAVVPGEAFSFSGHGFDDKTLDYVSFFHKVVKLRILRGFLALANLLSFMSFGGERAGF